MVPSETFSRDSVLSDSQAKAMRELSTASEARSANVSQKTPLRLIYRYATKKHPSQNSGVLTGNSLSSQAVSSQVLSTCECLTTVFGMGTGGTTQLSSPDLFC